MIGLAARAHPDLLGFHEVADVHALRKLRARAQACERADAAVFTDLRAFDITMRRHPGAGGQPRIADAGEGTDVYAIAQFHLAFQDHIDVDLHIAPDTDLATDVDPRRIGQAHTGQAQRTRGALLEGTLQLCQLPGIVGAFHFQRIGAGHAGGGRIFCCGMAEHVGQVVLALGVVAVQRRQPAPQRRSISGQDAGIDAADGALLRRGITVFDDRRDMAVGVMHDAAVAGRIGRFGHQHCEGTRRGHHLRQGVGQDQRHIAIEHQHSRRIGNGGHRLLQGMAGAQALRLFHEQQIRLLRKRRPHRVAAVADHDMDARRPQCARRLQHMRQHRPTGQRLQHLGQLRTHPLAFTCGKDHHMQRQRRRDRIGRSHAQVS